MKIKHPAAFEPGNKSAEEDVDPPDVNCWRKLPFSHNSGIISNMGVSKNSGTPKWMVCNGKPYQNGWFGGTTILGNPHIMNIILLSSS